MVDTLKRTPPPIEARAWLEPLPAASRYSLRGGVEARAAASRAFGVELPSTACRAATVGTRAALWLGPDEYLLIASDGEAASVARELNTALAAIPHSLVDISHRQIALSLKGTQAAWLLAHGCPLDLDLAEFPVGMCTRTVFVKAEILLWRTASDSFRIEVWRSFADYVVALLEETALELTA